MGQKVNPISMRLQVNKNWQSKWFSKRDYQKFLHEDVKIRNYILDKVSAKGGVSRVEIERSPTLINIVIFSSKPGMIIGRGGAGVEDLKNALQKFTKSQVKLSIEEIREPELDARLVAQNVATQIEKRIAYRRAMRQAMDKVMKADAQGVKISVSGRLGGAEIARRETLSEGKIPLHTIKADVDYALIEAYTKYGVIGVKAWVYKGDIKEEDKKKKQRIKIE